MPVARQMMRCRPAIDDTIGWGSVSRWIMAALLLAGILAAILGFAAHRASICTVRGVAEIMSSGTGYIVLGIGKSVLWVSAITIPVFLLMPSASANLGGWPLTGVAVLGGFVFGVGAAVNGACAYSTMARLADGEGRMLVAGVAFALGVLCFVTLVDWRLIDRPAPTPALVGSLLGWSLVVAAAVLVPWGLYEAARLWRTRPAGLRAHALVLAPQYRLSSAAMLIGMAGAAIFLVYGSTSYTVTLQQVVEGWRGTRSFPPAERWLLLLAILAGMLLSTLQRGSFRADWRPRPSWLRNVCGGLLMGLGVGLTPGGNDALVLYGIPSLSPHALPAFLAMVVGIALGLWSMRAWFGIEMWVACRNDLYTVADTPPAEKPPVP
jgi:uncharacterized membrane protein YedE/YeeE